MRNKQNNRLDKQLWVVVTGRNICYCSDDGGGDMEMYMAQQAAATQSAIAKEYLDFEKAKYEDQKPLVKKVIDTADETTRFQLDTAREERDYARAERARYKSLFGAVEQKVVDDAMSYDSQERIEKAANRAASDAQLGLSGGIHTAANTLARRGMSGGSVARELGQAAGKGALVQAGAMNNAREDIEDRAIGLRAGAASFGRGLPNIAGQSAGLGLQGSGMANASAMNPVQASSVAGAGVGDAYRTNVGAYGQQFQTYYGGYQAAQERNKGGLGGIGELVGMGIRAYQIL